MYYRSEIGLIEVSGTEEGISNLHFVKEPAGDTKVHPILQDCLTQIDEYFKGRRKDFTIKLQLQGTEFQKQVLNELTKIRFGKTASYKDIASSIGKSKATRAVGGACKNNKTSIIIPCHRVIGSNGKLTGYYGGIWRKQWLLDHERKVKH